MKKLPKAQKGAIIKGIAKFFGPAIGATGKTSKVVKPVSKIVKSAKSTSRPYKRPTPTPGTDLASNAKFFGKIAGQVGILLGPAYAAAIIADKKGYTIAGKKKSSILKKSGKNANKVIVNTNKTKKKK